jgi:hypothetical protein
MALAAAGCIHPIAEPESPQVINVPASARLEILLREELSSAFRPASVLVVLDGAVQYKTEDVAVLTAQREIVVFRGKVPLGSHKVVLQIVIRGNGEGVFSYLNDYKFDLKSVHAFEATGDKELVVMATTLEKGGLATPVDQRLAVEWSEASR